MPPWLSMWHLVLLGLRSRLRRSRQVSSYRSGSPSAPPTPPAPTSTSPPPGKVDSMLTRLLRLDNFPSENDKKLTKTQVLLYLHFFGRLHLLWSPSCHRAITRWSYHDNMDWCFPGCQCGKVMRLVYWVYCTCIMNRSFCKLSWSSPLNRLSKI